MVQRRCVITGASRGIGLATAIGLARQGLRLAMVSRTSSSGDAAADAVRRAVPGADVESLSADLAVQGEIRRLAAEMLERYPTIELLVHNAGVVTPERSLTPDGIETQFAVNHLAPFLLTQLLLDRLRASAPARIVVVASQVERSGRISFDDLNGDRNYDSLAAYNQSKLANVLFTYALARRLTGTGVTVNCLHPGVVRTGLLDTIGRVEASRAEPQNPLARGVLAGIQAMRSGLRGLLPGGAGTDWALTPEEGAKTTLMVATDPSLTEVSGRFFREGKEGETSAQSRDEALADRLWKVSETMVRSNR